MKLYHFENFLEDELVHKKFIMIYLFLSWVCYVIVSEQTEKGTFACLSHLVSLTGVRNTFIY
jgi:hypothetical protein